MRRLWLALGCAAVTALAGCFSLPRQVPPASSWDVRREQLQQRDHFELKGRVAVAAGQEGFNARLRWKQQGAHSQLALDGPLGVGGAQVEFDGETFEMVTARGQHFSDAGARAELAARFGFDPPLRSLRYWVQGVPDPAIPADEQVDGQRRLASLRQNDWEIAYGAYTSVDDQWLPERMTLRREGVRVRLLIDDWSAGGASSH